jgi:hypothetical protein
MKRRLARDFTPVGLGNPGGPPDAGRMLDLDRCRIGAAAELRGWEGWRRVGEKVLKPALVGAAANELLVMFFDPEYISRSTGHGIAVVDNSTNARGRVLAVGHHPQGLHGTDFAGNPRMTTGAGLDDLSVRAYYTGSVPFVLEIEIDATGTPDTFQATINGAVAATGVSCATTWTQIASSGIYVKFGATTGHTSGNVWTSAGGGRMSFTRAIRRLHGHEYPALVGAEGLTLVSHGFDIVYADDGASIRQAALPRPQMPPTIATEVAETSSGTTGIDQLFNETGDFGTGTGQWQKVSGTGVTVSRGTTTPDPPEGASYMELRVPQRYADGSQDLAFVNLSVFTIPAATTVVKVRLYLDEEDWIRNKMSNGAIALVFDANCYSKPPEKDLCRRCRRPRSNRKSIPHS